MATFSSVPQRAAIYAAVLVLGLAGLAETATAADDNPLARLRSSSATIGAALRAGLQRSETFRGLAARIEETDGIVYIEEGRCLKSVRACLLHVVAISGPNRLLQIRVEPRKAPGCSLVAAIGHELHHALEALSDSKVRDGYAMRSLFDRLGPVGVENNFETKAATRTGWSVEGEVCRHWPGARMTAFASNDSSAIVSPR